MLSTTAVKTGARSRDLKRLCFQTTSSDYRGAQLDSAGQMENLSDVLTMGHKANKYMQYPLRQVPNFGREASNYSKDFNMKPMGGSTLNNEIGEQLRDQGTNGSILNASLPSTQSLYSTDFGAERGDEEFMNRAKRGSLAPPHRYPEGGRLLYNQSFSQSMHMAPASEVNWKGADMRPSSSLANPRSHWEDAMRTTYKGDFVKREARRRRTPNHSFSSPNLLTLGPGQLGSWVS